MRTVYRRMSLGLLAAGLAGSAALGLGRPADPPPLDGPSGPPAEPAPLKFASHRGPIRHDPAVSLTWAGPAAVKVNRPAEYTLTVRNTCGQPVQKVTVQVRPPKGAAVSATAPAATAVGGVYVWDVGTLEPKAEKPLKLTITHAARGEVGCQAWVTFTGTAGMTVVVNEPKLEAVITAPATVALGDVVPVVYTIRSVGDCPAEGVRFAHGEQPAAPAPGPTPAGFWARAEGTDGPGVTAVGSLAPGQFHTVKVEPVATKGGVMRVSLGAAAADGLSAEAVADVRVLVPKLEAAVAVPAELVVGRKAACTVRVKNAGELPLDGVAGTVAVPDGFRPAGGTKVADGKLTFAHPGTLEPGQEREFTYDLTAVRPGPFTQTATVTASRGTKAIADGRTRVEGIPAMRMEVADLADPVEKGGETTYEIRLTNTGSKADADIVVVCDLPPELELISADGPVGGVSRHGINFTTAGVKAVNRVEFDPVTELAPKTEAVFRVKVRAARTGDVRFRATLTSKHLTEPVTKQESTRVYGD